MAKPPLTECDLYQVASYLARSEISAEIHAEILKKNQSEFEKQYKTATQNHPLPTRTNQQDPYYIWPSNANKYGKQLRIYFRRIPPEPPLIKNLCTDYAKWSAKREVWRINHSALVMQLFECGFILGKNHGNSSRIQAFMCTRFPVS